MTEKISFTPFSEENCREVLAALSASEPKIKEPLGQIMEGMLSSLPDDVSLAVSVDCGCVLLRVFDMGRYYFPFPYEILDGCDLKGAIKNVATYAMREEIPLVFTDTPPECLVYLSDFRHMNLDRERSDEPSYRVSVKTECDLLDEPPALEYGGLSFMPLSREDESDYAMLSRDENILKFWGYDYRNDAPLAPDSYFIDTALYERECGISLSYAIRKDGRFIGESVIYGFDGMGGAEIAVRIRSDLQGRGFGSVATLATVELCKMIGLSTVRTVIFKDNERSVKMVEKIMSRTREDGGRVEFSLNLD